MTAFVAGATGYVGRAVVAALVAAGHDTVAHVRPDSSRLDDWRQRFEELGAAVDSTPWELEPMQVTLQTRRPSEVFCLIGTTRSRAKAEGIDDRYRAVDYGLTRLLVEACVGAGITPRFIYLSSVGAGPKARGGYLVARWDAEEAVRDSGLPHVIARPSFITGPDRDDSRPGERVAAGLTDALSWTAGIVGLRKLQRYKSTDPETLAAALVRLAYDPDAPGRTVESEELREA
jgi:nucleoside-diphosphate-sugar epimerase